MARSGRARKSKARQPDGRVRPDKIEPTPETRAKLTADPLRTMVEKGYMVPGYDRAQYLDSDAERAADEVNAIYLAVCRDAMVKLMRFGREPAGRSDMSDYLAAAHAQRFVPWAEEHKRDMDVILRTVVEREDPGRDRYFTVAIALKDYARRMKKTGSVSV